MFEVIVRKCNLRVQQFIVKINSDSIDDWVWKKISAVNQFITFWLLHGLESFFQIVQRLMPYTCNFHLALSVSKTHISPKIQNKKFNAGIPFNSRVIQRINLKEYSNYHGTNLAREKTPYIQNGSSNDNKTRKCIL